MTKELIEKIKGLKLNGYLFLNDHWKKQAKKLDGKSTYEIYNQALEDVIKLIKKVPKK